MPKFDSSLVIELDEEPAIGEGRPRKESVERRKQCFMPKIQVWRAPDTDRKHLPDRTLVLEVKQLPTSAELRQSHAPYQYDKGFDASDLYKRVNGFDAIGNLYAEMKRPRFFESPRSRG